MSIFIMPIGYDSETPMEEIVRTFNYLINAGKIRYWATSEWPVEAFRGVSQSLRLPEYGKTGIGTMYLFFCRKKSGNQWCEEFL